MSIDVLEVRAGPVHLVDEADAREWYLVACRQTVSDWGSTPFFRPRDDGAVEDAHRRSTSTVKSTWPGVSIRLIVAFQMQVVAAELIVIPRVCSSSKSIVEVPSWTSPIL